MRRRLFGLRLCVERLQPLVDATTYEVSPRLRVPCSRETWFSGWVQCFWQGVCTWYHRLLTWFPLTTGCCPLVPGWPLSCCRGTGQPWKL